MMSWWVDYVEFVVMMKLYCAQANLSSVATVFLGHLNM